ncbi:hypothetical protein Syun_014833 [Stephania yunnanensis]|uniref:Uncharacterized protein n=1 Tax=Stephania yunnanensis TaxID=152371 RepID=A0AAP0P8W2_9MAGN
MVQAIWVAKGLFARVDSKIQMRCWLVARNNEFTATLWGKKAIEAKSIITIGEGPTIVITSTTMEDYTISKILHVKTSDKNHLNEIASGDSVEKILSLK